MTLSRQLMLSGLLILIFLFAGMITFVVRNTQTFLNGQLASHSQDTATALGLTLSSIMINNDKITAGRIVDAVWDRGYYRTIRLEDSTGAIITERTSPIKVYGIPSWFINLLDLSTVPKEAMIMSGWNKVGKVYVESNPGFAYTQIWVTFIDSLEWFLVSAFIAFVLGSMLLFIILRPLRAITAQAIAICNQQFPIQENLPWTIDLRLVVEAMNIMSGRLMRLFQEQAKTSELLREQAFKDPITKLGNRRYFDIQFDYILQDPEKRSEGGLMLIEVKDFKAYNEKYGHLEGDLLLQNIAKALETAVRPVEGGLVAQAKGASLFVILPNKARETVLEVAENISKAFGNFLNQGLSKVLEVAYIGVVLFTPQDAKAAILSKADMALSKAQHEGANRWALMEEVQAGAVQGATQWAAIFEQVIQHKQVNLYFQEAQLFPSQISGQISEKSPKLYEILMRLRSSEGTQIPAGVFMPMAERLNQITALDTLVLQQVIERITQSDGEYAFCVNLSPRVLEDQNFKNNFFAQLKSLGKKASHVIVELPEYGVINQIDSTREFFLKVSALGAKTSIDHYGKSFSSFSYLYNLKLSYLKIDGGFIKNIHENEENQFFVRSLVDIAHSLGICVIAEGVEIQAEYDALLPLKVDGAQGYYISKPAELVL